MTESTDILPDMTGDVPRCSTECQYYDIERRQRGPDWYDEDGVCRHESAMREPGDICLPAVRQLVQLSRRRCDGCRNWTRSNEYQELGFCRTNPDDEGPAWADDSFCSAWEAKP